MASNLSNPFFFSTSTSFFFFFFFFLLHLVSSLPNTCPAKSCNIEEPMIHFPFRLKQFQPDERCVYPGFDLSCNGQNRTTLSIPLSGEFIVINIDYVQRALRIRDQDGCLPKRLHNFTTLGSNWLAQQLSEFAVFKCQMESQASDMFTRVPCLDGQQYYVVVVPTDDLPTYSSFLVERLQCNYSHNISIPTIYSELMPHGILDELSIGLAWEEPSDCSDCERLGNLCGFEGKNGLETGCITPPPDLATDHDSSKGDTTGKWLILGISGSILMVMLTLRAHRLRARRLAQQGQTNPSSLRSQPQAPVVMSGLDTPTIESYPTTCVGDAEGPTTQDNSCSICLLEYRSKEVLRILPECKHSFHAQCVDPWLKRNASCPVCRNHQGSAKSTITTQGEDASYTDNNITNQHATQQVN